MVIEAVIKLCAFWQLALKGGQEFHSLPSESLKLLNLNNVKYYPHLNNLIVMKLLMSKKTNGEFLWITKTFFMCVDLMVLPGL